MDVNGQGNLAGEEDLGGGGKGRTFFRGLGIVGSFVRSASGGRTRLADIGMCWESRTGVSRSCFAAGFRCVVRKFCKEGVFVIMV